LDDGSRTTVVACLMVVRGEGRGAPGFIGGDDHGC
jgi:hypothetical protein